MYNVRNTKFKLKQLRLAHGYSQNEVAKKSNIKFGTYRYIETKPNFNITMENYIKLANLYNISIDYLINDNVKPKCHNELVILNTFKKIEALKKIDFNKDEIEDDTTLIIPKDVCTKALQINFDYKNIKLDFYPFNLLDKLYGNWVVFHKINLTKDLTKDLDEIFNKYLTEREETVLKLKYASNLTLEMIGIIFNVNKERIRQIEGRAIRKLRKNGIMELILYSTRKERESALEDIKVLELQIKKHEKTLINYNQTPVTSYTNDKKYDSLLKKDLDQLNISIRTYNSLIRADLRTIEDVLKIITDVKLLNIRSFGKKAFFELLSALEEESLITYDHNIDNMLECLYTIEIRDLKRFKLNEVL